MSLKKSLLQINTLVIAGMLMFNAQAGMVSSTVSGTLNSSLEQSTSEPDISATLLNSSYVGDASGGHFHADSVFSSLTWTDGSGTTAQAIDNGAFNLEADINLTAGTAFGNLTINGTVGSLGWGSGTLLTATLAQVGGPGMALNFIFNVTGGDASGAFGDTIGVIMGFTGYNGIASFGANFNSGDPMAMNAQANTFVAVPAPGTLALMLIGFGALAYRRKFQG